MECQNCKYCNMGAYCSGKWYCTNPNVSVFNAIDETKCFEQKEIEESKGKIARERLARWRKQGIIK